jgi:hypothetical protein
MKVRMEARAHRISQAKAHELVHVAQAIIDATEDEDRPHDWPRHR